MKILIIGGSGILSSAVVDACIAKGYDVTMLNRGTNNQYINKNAKLIICDVRDEKKVKVKMQGLFFDVVIDFIVYNLEQLKQSPNLFGNLSNQYIFISSAQVYNTSIQKIHEETDETIQPLWQYSVNKDICEKFLRSYSETHSINYTIVRPGVNYDNRRIPYGMYPPIGMHWTIVERIKAGKPIITWNNGSNRLNLTRVEDFAFGLLSLLGDKRAHNETFNVVGDYVYSWLEVLETLGELLNTEVHTIDIPVDFYAKYLNKEEREMLVGGRALDLVCSNVKLKDICHGFSTEYNLKKGLLMTLEWYKNNNYYLGIDYRWDAECDRIIKRYANGYRGGYRDYSHKDFLDRLYNCCVYNLEYYKDNENAIAFYFWKFVRKLVVKPLKKLVN